ncbi:MAG: ATP-binding cassette domain-containing protein [Acidimicrobiia bacterium]
MTGRTLRRRRIGEARGLWAASFRPKHYWVGTAAWIAFFIAPLAPGWFLGRAFDALEREATALDIAVLVLAVVVSELVIAVLIWIGHSIYMQGLSSAIALLRTNAVHGQLASGGEQAGRREVGTGDALARLRDDPTDFMMLIDNWVDFLGSVLYGIGAITVLARIDAWAAVAGVVPLMSVAALNSWVGHRARRYRQRARRATSEVTGFVNAAFAASLTVKVNGARQPVLTRLGVLNGKRAAAMVNDQVWSDAMWAMNEALSTAAVGLALLVAARRPLTAGEITIFATYLVTLIWLPQRFGGVIVGRRRFSVSAARLDEMVAPVERAGDQLVKHRALPILGGEAIHRPPLAAREPLQRLEAVGITVGSRGLSNVSFSLERGSLTVLSGPVGAGKSSLVQAVVGLLAIDTGEVRWNGTAIADRAAFFVPPQCAYVGQVPRLFAESLRDNVVLGREIDDLAVMEAMRLAAFADDYAALPNGLDTVIGSRGVRLSGGQAQRVAAVRAFVHRPELLVLDDLTSALDVETELAMWDALRRATITVLAVSNRPVALARADQVIRLEAGVVVRVNRR